MYDLLQMYDAGDDFKQIIEEDIMPTRVLDMSTISKHYSVRHAFKKLGKFAADVVIRESDIQWKDEKLTHIEEIIRLIGKRCSPNHLKNVTILFDIYERPPHVAHSHKFRTEIPDCLKSLTSLTLLQDGWTNRHRTKSFDKCLETLLIGCKELKTLKLQRITTNGKCLSALNSIELSELTIENCFFTESTFWTAFIQMGIPSLKSFAWENIMLVGGPFYDICKSHSNFYAFLNIFPDFHTQIHYFSVHFH